jgi:hypothetical protein
MFRGIERRRIFLDDEDRGALLQRLGILIHSSDAKMLAWVLLSNHALCAAAHKACYGERCVMCSGSRDRLRLLKRLATGSA